MPKGCELICHELLLTGGVSRLLEQKKTITQFQMCARDMEEDDSSCKINNARCKGLIRHVGKGYPLSSLDVGSRISGSPCALLAIEAPHQT